MSLGSLEVPVIRSSGVDADCPWSSREAELLAVTLQLLQEHGYDRLSLEAVATTARASKATLYRRWPTKAELVLAAFVEGTRQVAVDPDTGTLRGDLMQLGESICAHVSAHASTIRAVLVETSRSAALDAMMQQQFLGERKALMEHMLARAVGRGEIEASAITEDLWDVMPGYLIYRSILTGRSPSSRTVDDLVDNVIIPSLTRHTV
jgi:AcrR family transcriptional regulator